MRFVLLAVAVLAGCQPQSDSDTTDAPTAVPADAPQPAAETEALAWDGEYRFEEAQEQFAFSYVLILAPDLTGTLDVDGYQTLTRFDVRGAVQGDQLVVIATGTRPDHLAGTPAVGDTLFVLEPVSSEGTPQVLTRWRALEPNVPGTPRLGVAFDRLGDAADWTVTSQGAGALTIGVTVDQAREAGAELSARGAELGECAYARPLGGPRGLGVMMTGDHVARIDVWGDSEVRTDTGLGVGSTEAEVRRAYPDLTAEPHVYTDGQYLNVDVGDGRQFVFETDEAGVVTGYRVGREPEVGWVEGCS